MQRDKRIFLFFGPSSNVEKYKGKKVDVQTIVLSSEASVDVRRKTLPSGKFRNK